MNDPLSQARACFLEGLAAFEADRLSEAARQFEAALALAPGRPSVLLNLGITRMRLGQPGLALGLLQQVTALEPQDKAAWFHRATAHSMLGQAHAALQAWDRLLALEPQAAEAWIHRGSQLRELGRLSDAADSFRRARALGADSPLLDYYLAGVAGPGGPSPTRLPGTMSPSCSTSTPTSSAHTWCRRCATRPPNAWLPPCRCRRAGHGNRRWTWVVALDWSVRCCDPRFCGWWAWTWPKAWCAVRWPAATTTRWSTPTWCPGWMRPGNDLTW